MVREAVPPTGQAAPVQVPQPGSQKTLPVQTGQGRVGQGMHRVQREFQALTLPVSSVQVLHSDREQKRVCSVLLLLREPLLWVVSEPGLGQVLQAPRRPFQTDGRIFRSIFVPRNVQEHRNVDILS